MRDNQIDLAEKTADQIMALLERKQVPPPLGVTALMIALTRHCVRATGEDIATASRKISQLFADEGQTVN
jgi:hypothetical protein